MTIAWRHFSLLLILPVALLAVYAGSGREGIGRSDDAPASDATITAGQNALSTEAVLGRDLRDRWGDGLPEAARLDRPADREEFVRWITFLAEAQYYFPASRQGEEVRDCSALIRYAYRNALVAHTAEWRRAMDLPADPGAGDVSKFSYPDWPLGPGLFRTRPGPFSASDLSNGAFAEFADASTLLRFNTFRVSRHADAAQPGDLLFFLQPEQRQPYHVMLFVGRSHFQPAGLDWLVYHTGDVDGREGELRTLRVRQLAAHPDPRWRPLPVNAHFLGVYRLNLLR